MAKIIDNIISKLGTDKVLHFLIGAVVCAMVTFVFLTQETSLTGWRTALTPLSGTLFTLMAAWIKEGLDKEYNWKDFIATALGCIPVWIAVAIGVGLRLLN